MGAAEDRSHDSESESEFTPAERAKLRVLLDLIERGARERLRKAPVDESDDDKVRPTPEQLAEVRAKVRKHMKRQGAL